MKEIQKEIQFLLGILPETSLNFSKTGVTFQKLELVRDWMVNAQDKTSKNSCSLTSWFFPDIAKILPDVAFVIKLLPLQKGGKVFVTVGVEKHTGRY